jgi:hypothetical protein
MGFMHFNVSLCDQSEAKHSWTNLGQGLIPLSSEAPTAVSDALRLLAQAVLRKAELLEQGPFGMETF